MRRFVVKYMEGHGSGGAFAVADAPEKRKNTGRIRKQSGAEEFQRRVELASLQIAEELKKTKYTRGKESITLEDRIGVDGFKYLCRSLAKIMLLHDGLKPSFFGKKFAENVNEIERYYKDILEDHKTKQKANVLTTAVATTLLASIYGIDPNNIFALISKEQRGQFNASAKHVNSNGSVDLGVYQLNSLWKNNSPDEKTINRIITELGGEHRINEVPNFYFEDLTFNSFGAIMVLMQKMAEARTTTDWEKIYTAYNGSGADARAYGQIVAAVSKDMKKRYQFE